MSVKIWTHGAQLKQVEGPCVPPLIIPFAAIDPSPFTV